MPDTPSIKESPALKQAPRVSRLRLLVAGVLVLTVAGAFAVRALEDRARDEIFENLLSNRAADSERALGEFYRPIAGTLRLVPQWAASGVLQFDEPDRIRDHFVPMLSMREGVVALTIVGNDGRSYELRRSQDTWAGRLYEREDLDRRDSDWYRLATRSDQIEQLVSTEIPALGEEKETHLLAALAWRYADGTRIGAAALEMTTEITRGLRESLAVSDGSIVILIEEGDIVTWLAPGEERHFETASLRDITFSGDENSQLIARALLAWGEQGGAYELSFPVNSDRGEYWCRFLRLEEGEAVHSMALLIPRSDLDDALGVLTRPFLYALLGVIALGALVVIVIYQQYRRRLRELRRRGAHTALADDGLRELIGRGESERLEFKSTLRWNLKANKPGKEIELAWLKTLVAYLNTGGGTLLVGVADDGSVVGVEPDGFKNEDKYLLHFNNCVKQHIGIEFARFLSFDLRPIDGQQVLVVDARAADDPAFLVQEDEEEFYVRVGPASRKVSPRKALEYLRDSQ